MGDLRWGLLESGAVWQFTDFCEIERSCERTPEGINKPVVRDRSGVTIGVNSVEIVHTSCGRLHNDALAVGPSSSTAKRLAAVLVMPGL